MKNSTVRVRFAPSPTGLMHLGSVSVALLNYLFAHQKKGTFVLRIEDTDPERNFDPGAQKIIENLIWLGLHYDEGPIKGGPYGPYYQSERTTFYQTALNTLQEKKAVYRCFCSSEELDRKRDRQIALKLPPRYDRTCLHRSEQDINNLLKSETPFIWRFKIDTQKTVQFTDLARGTINFALEHFSDFPVTRQDGSFTFLFANAVDDVLMNITHIIRGEDHLSNTANQIVLYNALQGNVPLFWHLPIICNIEGKKLSKRDFGFSLFDLKDAGFLPEALCNYLGIMGGSFTQEIMSLEELTNAFNFDNLHATGPIKYDLKKLRWVNHQWINRYDPVRLLELVRPQILATYPDAATLDKTILLHLIKTVQSELVTLNDIIDVIAFYFLTPSITHDQLLQQTDESTLNKIFNLLRANLALTSSPDLFFEKLKQESSALGIPNKTLFHVVRLILTGSTQGASIKELLSTLGTTKVIERINRVINKQ